MARKTKNKAVLEQEKVGDNNLFIEATKEAENEVKKAKKGIIHTTKGLRLRKKPAGDIVKLLADGTEVEIVSHETIWTEIKVDDLKGFVMSEFVEVVE